VAASLRDTITGLDDQNTALLLTAIRSCRQRRISHRFPMLDANIVHVDIVDTLEAIGGFGIERIPSHIT
jgi:hypothetical protein